MNSSLRIRLAVLCAIGALLGCAAARAGETALDRYIAKPDPAYAWKIANTVKADTHTTFILDMTSQTWRTEKDVDQPVWKHWLTVVRPNNAKPGTGLLYIGGGSTKDGMPKDASARVRDLATGTQTVTAELYLVPNQPLVFSDSKDVKRSEDDIIAYTRLKYMETGDEEWPVRLAMVKSAVRAMDAMQELMKSSEGGGIALDKFVVAGGSKRGWTTWLVGVEDPRVVAIIPLVIDALNSQEITKHHFEAYGFFSTALDDYVDHGIFPHLIGTPEYTKALAIEDPYKYFDRAVLKMPKYLINAGGDQFFLPDNSQFYWNEMPEEKYLRYVPNAKHDLGGSDARESMQAFYQSVLDGTKRPKYSWKQEKGGAIHVSTADKPREVNLWQATNPKARDFRVDTIGKAWTSSPLSEQGSGHWMGQVAKPASGYTAFFVELVFDSGGKYPFKFTTGVNVVPDVLPFKWEDAAKKYPKKS